VNQGPRKYEAGGHSGPTCGIAVECGNTDFSVRLHRVRILFFSGLLQKENCSARHEVLTIVLLLWIKVFRNVTPYGLVVTVHTVSRHRELEC
jgi:hypothetical protein